MIKVQKLPSKDGNVIKYVFVQDDIGGGCGQLWYVQNWMKGI